MSGMLGLLLYCNSHRIGVILFLASLLFSSFLLHGNIGNKTQYSLKQQYQVFAQPLSQQESITEEHTVPISEDEKSLLYDNTAFGIKMKYPADWIIKKANPSNPKIDLLTGIISLQPPEGQEYANVSLGLWNAYSKVSLDEFRAGVINAYGIMSETYPGFTVINSSGDNITVAGYPGYLVSATYKDPVRGIQNLEEVGTFVGKKIYYFKYTASPSAYSDYLPIVNTMLESLQILSDSNASDVNLPSFSTPLSEVRNNTYDESTIGTPMSNETTTFLQENTSEQLPPTELPAQSFASDSQSVPTINTTAPLVGNGDNFLTYENSTYGLKISYPANWTYYGTAENGGFINIVVFQAPLEGRTDPSSAVFIVSRDTLPSDRSIPLKDYADSIIDQYKQTMPGFNLIESSTDGSVRLLNRPAYSIVSTDVRDGITYKTLEMGTIIGNRVYLINYDAEEPEFSKYQSIGQDMINSFQMVGLLNNGSSVDGKTIASGTIPGNMTFGENATISSTNVDSLLNEAENLSYSGRTDEAMELFDKALAIDPNNVNALSRKAYQLGYALGKYDEAIELYDRALAIDPNNTSTLLDESFTLRESGKYQEAIEILDRALAIDPNDTYLLNGKANVLGDLGRYDEAVAYYDKALAIDPMNTGTLRDKGLAFESLGRYQEAIEVYDKALAIDPNFIDVYNDKAMALESLGKTQEAIEYYDKALAIDPTFIFPLNNKGLALAGLGRYNEAIESFDKALAIDPNFIDALSNKGAALDSLGRSQEAIEYFDKALAINPDDIYALNNKGAALENLGRSQEAIEYYDKALGTQPIKGTQLSNEDLYLRPQYFSVSQIMEFTDFNKYEDHIGLQLVVLPKNSENTIIIGIVKNKAVALYNIGKYREANDNFDRILSMDANNIAGLYYKGLCLVKLGQASEAISYRNRATDLDPTYKGEERGLTILKPPLGQLFHIK